MELLASVGELAGEVIVDVGEACSGVGFGTRVGCQGVEVEVIYQVRKYVENSLVRIKQYSMSRRYFVLTY